MKILYVLAFLPLLSCSPINEDQTRLAIVPKPNHIEYKRGNLVSDGNFRITVFEGVNARSIEIFKAQLPTNITINEGSGTFIEIGMDKTLAGESYRLSIKKESISVTGGTDHGVFNGLQSVLNLLLFSGMNDQQLVIPCCEITDDPRFEWRGVMLDESRHFFGQEKVKSLLNFMALHKLNTFHWHLTDEPGWRIEIKSYPLLTEIGGRGNYHDPGAPASFYTQEQIREIIEYAGDRFISVIPEIDMPGHASAANRAYPEYSGGGSETHPEWTFNPGKEETYGYLTEILREIRSLFKTSSIHIGGDEVSFGNQAWNSNPDVARLMTDYELKDLKEVERYFLNRMADSLASLGSTLIGWDEIVEAGISGNDPMVMWWRHDKPHLVRETLDKGYQLVLCPRIPLYFDFVQDSLNTWGRTKKGVVNDLKHVYTFPPDSLPGMNPQNPGILGIQANIWSERIQNGRRLDYMTFPRLFSLSEAAWTLDANKDYFDFLERLPRILGYLDMKGIYYYNPFNPSSTPEPEGIPVKQR